MSQIVNAMNIAVINNNNERETRRVDPNKHYKCPYPQCSHNTEGISKPYNRVHSMNNHIARIHLVRVGNWYNRNEEGKYVCNRCSRVFSQKDGHHISSHLKEDGTLPELTCYTVEPQRQQDIQEQQEERDVLHNNIQEQEENLEEEQVQEEREIQQVNNREQDLLDIIHDQARTIQLLTQLLNTRRN